MSSRSWQEFITWSQKKQFPVKEQKARNELLFHSSNSLKTHVKLSLVCNTEGSCNLPVLLLAAECYCSHYPSKHMAFLMGIGILELQKEQQQVNQGNVSPIPFLESAQGEKAWQPGFICRCSRIYPLPSQAFSCLVKKSFSSTNIIVKHNLKSATDQ